MAGGPAPEGIDIETDLLREKASSLAETAEKLERALRALREVESALAAAPDEAPNGAPDEGELATRRGELREIAAERLWFLIVQREAIGLTQHEPVYRAYAVPPELRLLAGPRLPRRDGARPPRR